VTFWPMDGRYSRRRTVFALWATKLASVALVRTLSRRSAVRAGDPRRLRVYGPGEGAERLLTDLMSARDGRPLA